MMSRNLKKKMAHLTLIEDWFDRYPQYGLSQLFYQALDNNVFQNVYVAIRKNPENSSQAETETWNYYNVGADTTDIAEYFATKYGLNYFAYSFDDGDDCATLESRVESIYKANLYKYKKLIESMGYQYNPLFNVDALELYSSAESIGNTTNNNTSSGSGSSTTNPTTTHYVNPYDTDGDPGKIESKDVVTNNSTSQSMSGTNTTTLQHSPAENNYTWDETNKRWTANGIFSINAKDNAFGVQFDGPERYYAEKKIRQGNIGVTKATELLEDQRRLVRFNLLDEFFKDLEPHIVVGIY